MLTDESVLEWAKGWLLPNTPEDPTFRQRFLDGLAEELKARAKFRMALEVIRDMLGPNGREAFVMQGPRMFWVLRVVEDALK